MIKNVKYLLFLSDFNKTWIFSTDSRKYSNSTKIRLVGPCCCMRTERRIDRGLDRRTDMTKLIVVFRNLTTAPKMFQTTVLEKIKACNLCSKNFLRHLCHVWDNVEKYSIAAQAADDNMAHAHCVLDNLSYTHTHTLTHSQYVTLIAFPLQQWLHERATMLLVRKLHVLFTVLT
jgi:hypothetical protein